MTIEDINARIKAKVKKEMDEEWKTITKSFWSWGSSTVIVGQGYDGKGDKVSIDISHFFACLKQQWFNRHFDGRVNKAMQEFMDKVDKLSTDLDELRGEIYNMGN